MEESKHYKVFFKKNAFTFILRANSDITSIRPRSLAVIGSYAHLIPSGGLETSYVDLVFQRFTFVIAWKVII